jgi:hypothetical protein
VTSLAFVIWSIFFFSAVIELLRENNAILKAILEELKKRGAENNELVTYLLE